MLKVAFAIVALFQLPAICTAQSTNDCPTLSVSGPPGIPAPGELMSFTASVGGNVDSSRLKYVWSLTAGEIKSGQGTPTVIVDPKDRPLTATVEIEGFPLGCTATASEHMGGEPAASPVMFHELKEGELADDQAENLLITALRDHPTNQIYVLSAAVPGNPTNWLDSQEMRIRVPLNPDQSDRVTMVRVKNKSAFIQLWRVPPGAQNPRCEECEKWVATVSDCPTITITGPAGVVRPGEEMMFSVDVTGKPEREISYYWEVTDGAIMGGQGTPVLKARYTVSFKFKAIVTIRGLPHECPATASEVLSISGPEPEPEHLATINNVEYTIDGPTLRQIEESMSSHASSQLYVWIYVGSSPSRKHPSLRWRILCQLSATNVDPARFTLNLSSNKQRGAVFWLVPPGAYDPEP